MCSLVESENGYWLSEFPRRECGMGMMVALPRMEMIVCDDDASP